MPPDAFPPNGPPTGPPAGPPTGPPPGYRPPGLPPRRSVAPLVIVVAAIVALAVVAAAVVAVVLLSGGGDSDQSSSDATSERIDSSTDSDDPKDSGAGVTDDDRASALAAARTAVVEILGYDYRTIDDELARVETVSTPEFLGEYTRSFDAVRSTAIAKKAVITAVAPEVGLAGIDSDGARVLAFTDQTRTGGGKPLITSSTAAISLERVNDQWLVSGLDPATMPLLPAEPDPDRQAALEAALETATAFVNLDHRTVDADTATLLALTTGKLEEDYREQLPKLAELTRDNQSVATGEAWGGGLVTISGDTAEVIVATEGRVTTKATGSRASERNYRLRLTLALVGDTWLTSDVQFVGQD